MRGIGMAVCSCSLLFFLKTEVYCQLLSSFVLYLITCIAQMHSFFALVWDALIRTRKLVDPSPLLRYSI